MKRHGQLDSNGEPIVQAAISKSYIGPDDLNTPPRIKRKHAVVDDDTEAPPLKKRKPSGKKITPTTIDSASHKKIAAATIDSDDEFMQPPPRKKHAPIRKPSKVVQLQDESDAGGEDSEAEDSGDVDVKMEARDEDNDEDNDDDNGDDSD